MSTRAARAAFLLAAIAASSSAAQTVPGSPLDRDLDDLVALFEGRFDNYDQRYFTPKDVPDDMKHIHIQAAHAKIDAPALGKHVFYVEEWRDDDPTKIVRQRVVSFVADASENKIRMRNFFIKDAKAAAGAWRETTRLSGLTEAALDNIPTCDVWFVRDVDQFRGSMKGKTCQFDSPVAKTKVWSEHEVTLAQSAYWRVDRTYRVDNDEFASGAKTTVPFKFERAQPWICTLSFRKPGSANYAQWQRFDNLEVHDQGGAAWVDSKKVMDGKGKTYGIRLREFDPPYPGQGTNLSLFIKEQGAANRTMALASYEASAKEVFVSTQPEGEVQMQARCTPKPGRL
jgi:hypothetical protein